MAGCSDQRVCALLCGVVAAVAEAVSHVGMYAQASLLCLPEEDSDAGYFDGEPTNFADDYDLGRNFCRKKLGGRGSILLISPLPPPLEGRHRRPPFTPLNWTPSS